MSETLLEFLVPAGMLLSDLRKSITGGLRIAEDPPLEITRRFLDSFDWRLHKVGLWVEYRQGGDERRLYCRPIAAAGRVRTQIIDEEPGFAWDLPPGPVRRRLEPVLGVRRLLPIVEVQVSVTGFRLFNEEGNGAGRLLWEDGRLVDAAHGREVPLPARVRLLPVKGGEAQIKGLAGTLSERFGLRPAHEDVSSDALAAAHRCPGDYSSKPRYDLAAERRADASVKHILLVLLDILEANLEGAKANLDTEFLHDLRVATRRTRSALTQIKGVFPADLEERYKAEFAWVQQVTGPVRDLDVYLLDLDGYKALLPAQMQPHLEPVRRFLLDHYQAAHQEMTEALGSSRFGDLLSSWRAFLEAPIPACPEPANAVRLTRAVADERIWRLYRRVRRQGRAISPRSPAAELHELRKSCKKLRYLIEFFQGLYPKKRSAALIKMLKVLLDNLGRFQDRSVQAQWLTDMAEQMRAEGRGGTESLLAIGALVGHLLDQQRRARLEFERIFSKFDTRDHELAFRALFAPRDKASRRS